MRTATTTAALLALVLAACDETTTCPEGMILDDADRCVPDVPPDSRPPDIPPADGLIS